MALRRSLLALRWRGPRFSVIRRLVGLLAASLACVLVLILKPDTLFGRGFTIQGGLMGRKVDNTIKRGAFLWRQATWRHDSSISLPKLQEKVNLVGLPVLAQMHLYESVARAKQRAYQQRQDNTCCWRHPLVSPWYRPAAEVYAPDCIVSYSLTEMQSALQHLGLERHTGRDVHTTATLGALALLYQHGGAFRFAHDIIGDNIGERVSLRDGSNAKMFTVDQRRVMAPSPKDPQLLCILHEAQDYWNEHYESISMEQLSDFIYRCTSQRISLGLERQDRPSLASLATVRIDSDAPSDLRLKLSTTKKQNLLSMFKDSNCWSGWWCNRCLRMPWWGSFDACRRVCRHCYRKTMCNDPYSSINDSLIPLHVQISASTSSACPKIPRIVHQTWFEDLSAERYPHLHRLQQGWKASGWDYRFYNDTTALEFILEHYPSFVVDAYESILPGAFKADLFRLLLLLHQGGVYADVDVSLDVDLDSFVTPDLSFFVPRDVALDYWPDSNYCLWNGLMGAAPGHPIVAQAVEDVLNRILLRQDYLDVERDMCRAEGPSIPVWKLRSFPILLLTGPCALGISVNAALGRPRLSGFDLGFQATNDSLIGDVLVLLADRYDLGELRFTDIDRNLLVASTNADDFSKTPMRVGDESERATPAHYSQSESDIAGSERTYRDDLALSARIVVNLLVD